MSRTVWFLLLLTEIFSRNICQTIIVTKLCLQLNFNCNWVFAQRKYRESHIPTYIWCNIQSWFLVFQCQLYYATTSLPTLTLCLTLILLLSIWFKNYDGWGHFAPLRLLNVKKPWLVMFNNISCNDSHLL